MTEWKPTVPVPPQRTFALLKPDAASRAKEILEAIANEGFYAICGRPQMLTRMHVDAFYAEHALKRPLPVWYEEHAAFMESGVVIPLLIQNLDWHTDVADGEPALSRFRAFVGATDPVKAAVGTLRRRFGTGLPQNAIHASDSIEASERELAFFFTTSEIIDRFCF